MIPRELPERIISLPETDNYSIVLVTGNEIRHKRFAYRILSEFGDLVIAWYQVENVPSPEGNHGLTHRIMILCTKAKQKLLSDYQCKDVRSYILQEGFSKSIGKGITLLKAAWDLVDSARRQRKSYKLQKEFEKKSFGKEIGDLKQYAKLEPVIVKDPNSEDFIRNLEKLSPYFFLSLGGAIYGKNLLSSIRGVAINQHAGWSPDYKGSGTTMWALYNRNLNHVGNTIHITTSGLDAGGIFRRSNPCLLDSDTPESCFSRVVALGTELMIEVVSEIISGDDVYIYDQSEGVGQTYLGSQLNGDILKSIHRDFSRGWLKNELLRLRNF